MKNEQTILIKSERLWKVNQGNCGFHKQRKSNTIQLQCILHESIMPELISNTNIFGLLTSCNLFLKKKNFTFAISSNKCILLGKRCNRSEKSSKPPANKRYCSKRPLTITQVETKQKFRFSNFSSGNYVRQWEKWQHEPMKHAIYNFLCINKTCYE